VHKLYKDTKCIVSTHRRVLLHSNTVTWSITITTITINGTDI